MEYPRRLIHTQSYPHTFPPLNDKISKYWSHTIILDSKLLKYSGLKCVTTKNSKYPVKVMAHEVKEILLIHDKS